MKYESVKLQPLPNHKFKLLEDLHYKDIVVPAGFKTNGADVPRFLWWWFPPNRADYLPAVIIHDYLCEKKEYKKADEYFDNCLIDLGVNDKDRVRMVRAVKFYHRIKYNVK